MTRVYGSKYEGMYGQQMLETRIRNAIQLVNQPLTPEIAQSNVSEEVSAKSDMSDAIIPEEVN